MKPAFLSSVSLSAEIEQWPLAAPFRISNFMWERLDVLVITLKKDGKAGRGEAAGVYFKNDTPAAMLKQIESLRENIEAGVSRLTVQTMLPPGGARNALDCALWDLEAKLVGQPAWKIAGLERPRPFITTFTCGADTPEKMAAAARGYQSAQAIKLKLMGDAADSDRVRAVRTEREDVWLGVDANQGFTTSTLERLMPALIEARVSLIEQPFPVGQESLLDGLQSPIPIAADESVQCFGDLPKFVGRVDVINIKLDKCGGLTEGLAMVRAARALGLSAMVGNMIGTSLAMAPAFLVGQLCKVADLDGPIFLKQDRANSVQYSNGLIDCPDAVWGSAES